MKYIINESQRELHRLLRRWGSEDHEELMSDIVYEGLDYIDVCDHPTVESYSNAVIESSATTFLFHWLNHRDEKFNTLFKIVKDKMDEDFYFSLYQHYYDNKSEC